MPTASPFVIVGVDVSKSWLDASDSRTPQSMERLDNTPGAIKVLLDRLPAGACLGVESTNTYHLELVQQAHERGLRVFLINGYRLKHYAEAVGQRMRTDAIDAHLIRRYLASEIEHLVPFTPRSPGHVVLWKLMKQRARTVQERAAMRLSWKEIGQFDEELGAFEKAMKGLLDKLEQRIAECVNTLGWDGEVKRLQRMPGVGRWTAVAMVAAYHCGTFANEDAFIAYLGLDVRAKDSGTKKGTRRLSRRGDGEYRRLLYCAAMAAARHQANFKARYEALLAKGRATTEALMILSRRIARLAFTLLRKKIDFDATKLAPA